MNHDQLLRSILDRRLLAVIRLPSSERVLELASAIREGGISAIELTLTTPNALAILPKLRELLGPNGIAGAGTVLDGPTARAAIDAGADFLVSPSTSLDVISTARRYGKISIPGAFTCTEILTAWDAGADIVKVFPVEVLGPAYFRSIRRPLPQIRIAATGGIDVASAREFLAAGACCIGAGGALSDPATVAAGQFDKIRDLAKQFVELVKSNR